MASSHDTNHLEDELDTPNTSKDIYADKDTETHLKQDGFPLIFNTKLKGEVYVRMPKKA